MRKRTNKTISVSWQQIMWVLFFQSFSNKGKWGLKGRFACETVSFLYHDFPLFHSLCPGSLLLSHSLTLSTHVCGDVYICFAFPSLIFSICLFVCFWQESQSSVHSWVKFCLLSACLFPPLGNFVPPGLYQSSCFPHKSRRRCRLK